jgi:2-dehydro-3-deoxygalactonokinase
MTRPFIAIDWGTTSFRAYHVSADAKVLNERRSSDGILAVEDSAFEEALEQHLNGWDMALPIVAAGMITSRQGWVEVPYVDCPAGPAELAKANVTKTLASGRTIHFSTGLHIKSESLGHDVMRSEETQVFGSLASGAAHFVTPGTHSKWIAVGDGRIVHFETYVTGESFALYRNHSILGRLMAGDGDDEVAFMRGVEKALADPAGLLHSLFSVRSLGLYNELKPEALSSYLSGLLIGAEVAHATLKRKRDGLYLVLASPAIAARYLRAMHMAGLKAEMGDSLAIVAGERLIAQAAGII